MEEKRSTKFEKTQEAVVNRLHGDRVIWIIYFLLCLISIALIYSASSSLAYMKGSTNFGILMKQLRFVIIGFVALYVCYKVPPKWYRRLSFLIYLVSVVLLLITLVAGSSMNDAQRWLSIGGIQFQPAEIAKIAIVLYLARALEVMQIDTYKQFLIKIIAPIGLVCVLVLVGSVSAAMYMALICFVVLLISGVNYSYIFKTAGLAAAGVIILILLHLAFHIFPRMDTAVERFSRFFQSEQTVNTSTLSKAEQQRLADETLQADMAQIAVKEGKLLGKGPGKSTQCYVLPHPYSDYIYSIIIEEYGIIGGVFVLFLYIWLFYRCVSIVRGCRTTFSAITVGGLGGVIVIQAMLHILVNVGIFPVTGHTLPLVSLGGTSFVIISGAFGIILSVSRKREEAESIIQEKEQQEKEEKRAAREEKKAAQKAAEQQEGPTDEEARNLLENLNNISGEVQE